MFSKIEINVLLEIDRILLFGESDLVYLNGDIGKLLLEEFGIEALT